MDGDEDGGNRRSCELPWCKQRGKTSWGEGEGEGRERAVCKGVTHERILRSLQADFHQRWANSSMLLPVAMEMPHTPWLKVREAGC